MYHVEIEILSALFLVIALLLINLMLGISPLQHSSIFLVFRKQSALLVWKFECVNGSKFDLLSLVCLLIYFVEIGGSQFSEYSWEQEVPAV